MFFDNIILFLNVLEQFAIRVTIFDFNIGDIIKYVNKIFFFDGVDGAEFFNSLTCDRGANELKKINPNIIVKNQFILLDQKLENTNLVFKKINYDTSSFTYIYG